MFSAASAPAISWGVCASWMNDTVGTRSTARAGSAMPTMRMPGIACEPPFPCGCRFEGSANARAWVRVGGALRVDVGECAGCVNAIHECADVVDRTGLRRELAVRSARIRGRTVPSAPLGRDLAQLRATARCCRRDPCASPRSRRPGATFSLCCGRGGTSATSCRVR
jgi:hypothetical protein